MHIIQWSKILVYVLLKQAYQKILNAIHTLPVFLVKYLAIARLW